MPTFKYEARNEDDQIVQGTVEAANLRIATQELMRQQLKVLNIREVIQAGTRQGCGLFVLAAPVLVALALHVVQ